MTSAAALEGAVASEPRHGRRIRPDLAIIAEMVAPASRVLDVGCGDGALLEHLVQHKGVVGRGLEISQTGVNACVSRGLSVIQGDADRDLKDYPDNTFNYAILSLTLQATREPRAVLEHLVRIGRRAIVSFPNFGQWRLRTQLFLGGRMPVTEVLPEPWYVTQNIHLCTIRDFVELCRAEKIEIERGLTVSRHGVAKPIANLTLANLFGQQATFLLCKR